MKRITIISGHPDRESYSEALADAYAKGAREGNANVTYLKLRELRFSLVLEHGYRKRTQLERDLFSAKKRIADSDHLVFVYPTWWGFMPALMKGFIDRVFLPGFAFKYKPNSLFWDKYFTGKSARVITTMDAPYWYYWLANGRPGEKLMKNMILEFCGVKPVKFWTLDSMRYRKKEWLEKKLIEAEKLGFKESQR
ncbi:NAD(P)H-dependent oxidoreductase [Leptospira sp. GIMC2001]|uniref:NAD(P)H-dependent oxidoreductase n=1 Tax=Leptospira sp. GIMC2001 TaxID=1513297 RepID=UPI002349DFAE|nr:NAD(P)H-dependent oxidoreductase [Leptospira sp. GIMC2001]WCL49845.1 NAD(P)H-dependent oxidoreductase [Leptospira sp. GIMC2001]